MARWNGNSELGLCLPSMVPSFLIQTISLLRREPLSMAEGVTQISPRSSMIEMLPPEVVVRPRLYILLIVRIIWSRGCIILGSRFIFHKFMVDGFYSWGTN